MNDSLKLHFVGNRYKDREQFSLIGLVVQEILYKRYNIIINNNKHSSRYFQ